MTDDTPAPDKELLHNVNTSIARIAALERLITEYIGADWTPERVQHWAHQVTSRNDDTRSPSEFGRALHQDALDKLGTKLLAASRRYRGL